MDVFTAVAEPVRRDIIALLGKGSLDAGSIGTHFSISQPGISRHLRVLRETGIIEATPEGQRRIYRLRPEGLRELESWVDRYREFWSNRLDALSTALEEQK